MKLTAFLVPALGVFIYAQGQPLGSAQGQQAPPAAPPQRPVPLAANTFVAAPDTYYGQVLSITASVDRALSATVFIVDHDRAKSSQQEVLVIAPTLAQRLEPNAMVTVVGEAVKFDPAELAKKARDYKLDADAAALARYQGRPAIIATAVVTGAMVDLARPQPRPMTADEEVLDKAMKKIGPAFTALRTAAGESNAKVVGEQTKILQAAFAEAETVWKTRGTNDALDWNRTAKAHLQVLEKATASANWDQVKTSVADVNRMCSTCHGAYRERMDDGSYRLKIAPPK